MNGKRILLRLLALTTALMLTLYVSVPGNFNPRTNIDVGYTTLADDSSYTSHKHDEKKFLLQEDLSVPVHRAIYSPITTTTSKVTHEVDVLNIRGPPAPIFLI